MGAAERRYRGGTFLISLGETLCLERQGDGAEHAFLPVSESRAAVRVTLEAHDELMVLELENGDSESLYYTGLPRTVDVALRGAIPRRLVPGQTSRQTLRRQDEIELALDPQLEPAPLHRAEGMVRRPRHSRPRPFWFGMSVIGSLHSNRHDELDEAFQQNGYSAIPTVHPILGYAFDFGAQRWRASADLSCPGEREYGRPRDGREFGVGQCFLAAYGGWDVLRHERFALFPLLGIGGGDLQIDYDPNQPPLLASELRRDPSQTTVRQDAGVVVVALGIEQTIRLTSGYSPLVLMFGSRFGYAQQFAHSGWHGDSLDVSGGPAVDLSGPFMRLGLGVAVEARRW